VLHVLHATGQAAATPGSLQRLMTSLFPAHSQDLEILMPFFRILSRIGESTQFDPVGDSENSFDGDCENDLDGDGDEISIGAPVGADDGDGEGLIDLVGLLVGFSEGVLLGSRLGTMLG